MSALELKDVPRPIDRYARRQKWEFRGKGPGGRNLCFCGCGREVLPPRRTAFSDACVTQHRHHSDPATIRGIVEARDRGVCALCGTDTGRQARIVREHRALWTWLARRHFEELFRRRVLLRADGTHCEAWGECHEAAWRSVDEQVAERGWDETPHRWEADHIVPVSEGGGGCGPEGYRTLCLPCHRTETARLAARLAARRRQPDCQ